MNYTETYEVRQKNGNGWVVLDTFDREHQADNFMDSVSRGNSGVWHVVRVSEVTVASIAKA